MILLPKRKRKGKTIAKDRTHVCRAQGMAASDSTNAKRAVHGA